MQPHMFGVPPPPHVSGAVHWASLRHWTQLPAPSQSPVLHMVPLVAGAFGTPFMHGIVQALPSSGGVSVSSGSDWLTPLMHSFTWQSPGVCMFVTVPSAWFIEPHVAFLLQTNVLQKVSVPQSAGDVQPEQTPPMHASRRPQLDPSFLLDVVQASARQAFTSQSLPGSGQSLTVMHSTHWPSWQTRPPPC